MYHFEPVLGGASALCHSTLQGGAGGLFKMFQGSKVPSSRLGEHKNEAGSEKGQDLERWNVGTWNLERLG